MKHACPNSLSTPAAQARRGFSLIEMLTVITMAAFLFGIVITMLVSLMQWDRDVRSQTVYDGEIARLVDVMRDDVRRATDVSCPADDLMIVALPDDRRIEYRLEEQHCRRNAVGSDEPAQGGQLFSIGLPGYWQVERDELGRGPLVTVRLNRMPKQETDPAPLPIAVSAALGADLWPATKPSEVSSAESVEPSELPDEAPTSDDEP